MEAKARWVGEVGVQRQVCVRLYFLKERRRRQVSSEGGWGDIAKNWEPFYSSVADCATD